MLSAGLGGMGGAQPLAVTLNGGVGLFVEIDRERIERRLALRYLDGLTVSEIADHLDRTVRGTETLLVRARAALRRIYREEAA